jgi:hypothetical protein
MKKKLIALTLIALSTSALAQNGNFTVTLNSIKAVDQTGSPDKIHDANCWNQYKNLKQNAEVTYNIDPNTYQESASAKLFGSSVQLYPQGIAGKYSFISDSLPTTLSSKNINRVIVSMDTHYNNQQVDILFSSEENKYNCLLSGKN